MSWDSEKLARYLGVSHPAVSPQPVERILFDSRQYSAGSPLVFFALRGPHHNGHHHIAELYRKGLRVFVVDDVWPSELEDAVFLPVQDSRAALQGLARRIREEIKPELVAVTGSNGKTVVKEWVYRLLPKSLKPYRSPKSYNSQIGVPLSLWAMPEDTRIGIFEAGISMPGEMANLQSILQPRGGIFTNIGSAHGENFVDDLQKIREKLSLFKEAEYLIYDADQEALHKEILRFADEHAIRLLSWSRQPDRAKAWLEIISQETDRTRFIFHGPQGDVQAEIPFSDAASVQNAVNALYQAMTLAAPKDFLIKALAQLNPIEMRLEMKEGHQNTLLINDAYNSDLESLRVALHFLTEHGKDRSKVLVLSDMLQSGLKPKALSKAMSEIISAAALEAVFAVGESLQKYPLEGVLPVHYFRDTDDFLRQMSAFSWQDKAILLKGSRPFAFERIDQQLARQRHETVMEIHLNRLVHNLNYYRGRLKEGTKLMVMVKAFAYGAGSEEVARVLAFHGVDYLAVAYADEGVALRKAGVALPIMVLNPESSALDSFFDYDLEPEIYSFKRLEEIAQLASQREQALKVHLKLETGMNRLGFQASEIPALQERLREHPQLQVVSMFSHLAASDDPQEQDFTRRQIRRFEEMSTRLQDNYPHPIMRHLANTGAIEAYPEAYYDMVRLGIGLYGVAPHPAEQAQLLPVAELKATVSQLKSIKEGESVGYGRAWRASHNTRIAIISIGYADGFSRSLSEGKGSVMINAKRYPIVGRVCMDMCMVEVGNDPVKEGDEVLIFGSELPIQAMAQAMNTIAYEVLTGISPRVKRVYFMA